jgi:hypothetical protein
MTVESITFAILGLAFVICLCNIANALWAVARAIDHRNRGGEPR